MPCRNDLLRSGDDRYGVKNAGHTLHAAIACMSQHAEDNSNKHHCCSTASTSRICHMCIVCYPLLLAHCAERSLSSGDSVGSHTAIRGRCSRERVAHDDKGIIRQPGSEKFW